MFGNGIVRWSLLTNAGVVVGLGTCERDTEIPGFRRAVIGIFAPAQMCEILRAFIHAIVGLTAAIVAICFFLDAVRLVRCFFCFSTKLLKLVPFLIDG